MGNVKIKFIDGSNSSSITKISDSPFKQGGEGNVYLTDDSRYVIKIYHKYDNKKEDFIDKVLEIGKNLNQDELKIMAWPRAKVVEHNGKRALGVVSIFNKDTSQLKDFIYNKKIAAKNLKSGFNYGNYFIIARQIAHIISTLHGLGCAHADLSDNNFLVNKKVQPIQVTLIDLDGVVVPAFLPPNVEGTRSFMAPEIIKKESLPNKDTDKHSLAVLIFQTLLFRNPLKTIMPIVKDIDEDERLSWGDNALFSEHSRNYKNRPTYLTDHSPNNIFQKGPFELSYKIFPPFIQKLFDESFVDYLFNAENRPDAKTWLRALSNLDSSLFRCEGCEQYIPYPYWLPYNKRYCHFCGKLFPQVLILRMSEPPQIKGKGYHISDYHLVLTDKHNIYRYQVIPKSIQPLSRKDQPIIGLVQYINRNYRIINKSNENWKCITKSGILNEVKPNEFIIFEPELKIIFGQNLRMGQFV